MRFKKSCLYFIYEPACQLDLFPLFVRSEEITIFKVCSSHSLSALISEETSITPPLWKLDYNKKIRAYIKHNTAVWFFKASNTLQHNPLKPDSVFTELTSHSHLFMKKRLPNFTPEETLPLPFGLKSSRWLVYYPACWVMILGQISRVV